MSTQFNIQFTPEDIENLVALAEMALDSLHEELDDFDEHELKDLQFKINVYNAELDKGY